ncbi:TolC family protein [Aestuariirhabdus litorea]|uniref:TolC family protein n=1 Tax=Aestuariirhabdus litorea TaxID=2528527 RepID=A0A3P3VIZ9_9GAMM|nr:TolC family protein [Aestuariirhabdus litorea]RRJ82652.1 TolC family protein [Aestuariirhabdus litorea]RWW92813.1 TolC family protein [Endozoicomonadaceae bacterium GTF-13]
MRVLPRLVLALGLLGSSLSPAYAQDLTLDQALQRALEMSPRLSEIEARYRAALEVPDQVGALPDPTLTLGMLNVPTDTFDLDQEPMTQMQVSFSQALPWLKARELASSAAQHQARATAAELDEARNMLRRDVSRTWWGLYFVERSLAVTDENLLRLREFNRIAQSRYRVGQGLQQDTLQAQLELSNQLSLQLSLQNQRRILSAQLNALLAQAAEATIGVDLDQQPVTVALPPLSQLIETALEQRPAIRQQQKLVEAAADRRAQAEVALRPDISLGGAYGYRQDAPNGADRADFLSFNIGIKLPIYAGSKQHKAISQRGQELISRQEALYVTQLNTRSEVVQAASDYQRAQEQQLLLLRGIIPQSQQTVASMLSGYQVNKVDFSALIQAQLMANRVQVQYWKTLSEGQQALATLYAATGGASQLIPENGERPHE